MIRDGPHQRPAGDIDTLKHGLLRRIPLMCQVFERPALDEVLPQQRGVVFLDEVEAMPDSKDRGEARQRYAVPRQRDWMSPTSRVLKHGEERVAGGVILKRQ